ncbi:hypothetical protein EDD11_006887 [Mortierella claussenii]|nr:hypothetical protein EDD11_006887 [Mortierella claussenii]
MSSSPDKSRLDIHHNSVALSNGDLNHVSQCISTDGNHGNSSNDNNNSCSSNMNDHTTTALSMTESDGRQEREYEDAHFSYLAPIATSLLTCHGDHFFDVVVEELSIHLGVKYAFISQLVSLEELKELDPTEYMNLIEQFGGVVPPIDGVMHNISSWPGGEHINPHAFQGYLTDCTIQDKATFLNSNLADKHQDVSECLMDHTIESYVGMRLETAQGEIVGVIGIIHDRPLTEQDGLIVKTVLSQVGARVANELDRLRIEANLVYARDIAESTAKNKTKFLADMSHEIRNPMNAVVGVTDILLDTVGLSDEQTSYIEVIRTSGQHLLTVINDILDISRIDQDVKFLLERRPLSLRKCLKDAVSLAGLTPLHDVSRSISVIEWPPEMDDLGPFNELEETNILPLLWSIDHDVPEHLLGDITRLRQVLINLCTNSLKFTQRGRVSVHVSIHKPTPQHPTFRPSNSPMVTRTSSHTLGDIAGSIDVDTTSSPSSPMLNGSDHRTQMVFQQRYDVKADTSHNNSSNSSHAKATAVSTRRRHADKQRQSGSPVTAQDPSSSSSTPLPNTTTSASSLPPSLTVVAPTANSLAEDRMDENTVILEFAVSDTGVGIPANKIRELFTSFSQVDISVSTRFGGTGLGLAISASLVEKMGGNIWVESTEGVGSRFTFTIPFTVCQSSETESHPSITAPSSPVSVPIQNESAVRSNSNNNGSGNTRSNKSNKNNSGALDSLQLPAAIDVAFASAAAALSTSSSSLLSPAEVATPSPLSSLSPLVESQRTASETVRDNERKDQQSFDSKQTTTPISTVASTGSSSAKPTTPTYAKVVETNLKALSIDKEGGSPLRILLAEDNAVNQKIAVGVLKKLGYENVDVVENGLEVIDKLDSGSIYDVILMDVNMPVMSGIDATKAIVERRKRGLLAEAAVAAATATSPPETATVATVSSAITTFDSQINRRDVSSILATGPPSPSPCPLMSTTASFKDYKNLYVIALTASAMGSDKERCMGAGMDDFMTKPFAVLEMKRVLNEFVKRWNSGALQTRNEACLAAAQQYLALKNSRCHSPNCQHQQQQAAGGSLSATKEHVNGGSNSRSLTPTLGRSSSTSSSSSLVDSPGSPRECSGCGGALSGNDSLSDHTTSMEDGGANGSTTSTSSPTSLSNAQGRACRMETPRPLRRNLETLGCSLFSGRRSHSEAALAVSGPSTAGTVSTGCSALQGGGGGGALGAVTLEGANLARRASDAFAFSKREWRSGLGMGGSNGHGHDVHPLDTTVSIHHRSDLDQDHQRSYQFQHQPINLRVKRVMSPSGLSKEQQQQPQLEPSSSLFKPMPSPLSPLNLLTSDTVGSSLSISSPMSSVSVSSPTEAVGRSFNESSFSSSTTDAESSSSKESTTASSSARCSLEDISKSDTTTTATTTTPAAATVESSLVV